MPTNMPAAPWAYITYIITYIAYIITYVAYLITYITYNRAYITSIFLDTCRHIPPWTIETHEQWTWCTNCDTWTMNMMHELWYMNCATGQPMQFTLQLACHTFYIRFLRVIHSVSFIACHTLRIIHCVSYKGRWSVFEIRPQEGRFYSYLRT